MHMSNSIIRSLTLCFLGALVFLQYSTISVAAKITQPVETGKLNVADIYTIASATSNLPTIIPNDFEFTNFDLVNKQETTNTLSMSMTKEMFNQFPLVIDNDETNETQATIEYKDLPCDDGKTKIKTGAKFPVVVVSGITSKTAKVNDPIQARLKYDLKIGDRLIAPKGAQVRGHINYVLKARTTMHSLLSPERWYRNSGCLGLTFDEIINPAGEHLPLAAAPARSARIIKNKGEGRVLGVNHNGQVTGPWSQQLRYKAIRVGLNAALAPAGVFSFGAMPVALGLIGAANPSFAFMKPIGLNVRHRRIKGFAWGFLGGIPGSWLIEDTTIKGQEAIIKPGDEFLVAFVKEFTGEPAVDAELMPSATTKVHGQIISGNKHSHKKKN